MHTNNTISYSWLFLKGLLCNVKLAPSALTRGYATVFKWEMNKK